MLTDAVDGLLSVEEQEFFDAHIAGCGPCAEQLAEARRGAAWLEMLKAPAPEPPMDMVEKILAQTSGAPDALRPMALAHPAPAMAPGYAGNVLEFPHRAATAMRRSSFGALLLQPRLAMTAAMAFLSIALTMDLTGVNPMELRASDLSPSSVKRAMADMNTRVVQYYEGLRVVYELESRVHDFQNVQSDAVPAQQSAPAEPAKTQPAPEENQAPAGNGPDGKQPERQEQDRQQGHSKATPGAGVSRREEMEGQRQRLEASVALHGAGPERRAA